MRCAGRHRIISSIVERLGLALCLTALLATLVACAARPTEYATRALSDQEQQHVAAQPAVLQPLYRKLYEEGRRNEVLNRMEIGLTAFRHGHYRHAEQAFDAAIVDIESVFADNEAARRARSLWYQEDEKDFKGEPYERAMVYLYRGLLYLRAGDYDNARASFLGGLLHDSFAEEEQHIADFAAFMYLAGWAARKAGFDRLADEHFAELQEFRPDAPLPDADHNVLLFVETGTSPRKLGDGMGHHQMVYRRGRGFEDVRARVEYDGRWIAAYPLEDIYFQASTRGGRAVDRIIEGQVQFKRQTESVGSNLTSVTNNSVVAGLTAGTGVFAAVSAVGVGALALSARANPRADIRYWGSLPDTIHVYTVKMPPGAHVLNVEYLNEHGGVLPELGHSATAEFDENGNGILYASPRR